MYGEVGAYVAHGLALRPGAVVVDVGANIGIFSLWAYEQCAKDARIYAFEPIPATFAMLQANFQRIDAARLHALPYGLGAAAATVQFAYYPNATFASTAYPDSDQAELHLTETLLARSLDQLPKALSFVQHLPPAAQRPLIRLLSRYINQRQQVTCQIETLSAMIARWQIPTIDFLKIDAEKSELDVLHGITPNDWPKIQQLFLEVHDRQDRVNTIVDLLRANGFRHVIAEQDPFFANTEIHAIYAKRNDAT